MKRKYKEPLMKPVELKTAGIMAGSVQFRTKVSEENQEQPLNDGANTIGDYTTKEVKSGWED